MLLSEIRARAKYIYPPAVVHLDGLGMSHVEKLTEGQDACPETHFRCRQGFCLPTYLINNLELDCPWGEDEQVNLTCPGHYRCHVTASCIHPRYLCDGISQCPYTDDERYCQPGVCPANCTCEGQAFSCRSDFNFTEHLQLRYLDLSGSLAPDLTDIGFAEHLQLLNLSSCSLAAVSLSSMAQLRILDLSHNSIRRFEQLALRSLQELLHLDVSFNPLGRVLGPSFSRFVRLAGMIKLQTLKMVGTGLQLVQSPGLARLPRLTTLDLRRNRVGLPRDRGALGESLRVLYTDNPQLCCPHFHPGQLAECHAPRDELSSCGHLLRSDFLRALLWALAAMALTGNAGVLVYRACLERPQGTSLAYRLLVTNLSAADLLMGVYMALIGGADISFRDDYVLREEDWRGSGACKAAGFLALLSSEVSAFVLCLITLDRFFLLRFPFSRRLRLSRLSASLACAAAWGAGFVLAAVPLFQPRWRFYGQNSICLPLPVTRRQFPGQPYAFAVFILLNFVLFLFIGAGQLLIYRSIRSSRKAAQRACSRQEVAIARRLLLIVLSDFCCWFPIGLMGLLAARGARISDLVNVWAGVFVLPLNSALNPFLYTLNTLLERRADRKERTRVARVMSNLQVELRTWPHDKVLGLMRYCLTFRLLQVGELLDEEGQVGQRAAQDSPPSPPLPPSAESQPES